MRRNIGKAVIALVATTMAVATLSMKAEAAEKNVTQKEVVVEAEVAEVPVVAAEGTVRTGTLGDNNGVIWTYDESTKTLTVTGEDSGVRSILGEDMHWHSPFYNF